MSDVLDAGVDVTTADAMGTDIPEDFEIGSTQCSYRDRVQVTVPQGAVFLFLSADEDRFDDNPDADGDFGVEI